MLSHESEKLREALAQAVASRIVEDGRSWAAAKNGVLEEARREYGSLPSGTVPTSAQVETAVRAHYALFSPEEHAETLARKRRLALEVLGLFNGIDCYLTGAVLNGAAGTESPVMIEVVHDDIKEVLVRLLDAGLETEALDTAASTLNPVESVGFVTVFENKPEAVRIDITDARMRKTAGGTKKPDIYQKDWEARPRISAQLLRAAIAG